MTSHIASNGDYVNDRGNRSGPASTGTIGIYSSDGKLVGTRRVLDGKISPPIDLPATGMLAFIADRINPEDDLERWYFRGGPRTCYTMSDLPHRMGA